jgi:hypothetical protein
MYSTFAAPDRNYAITPEPNRPIDAFLNNTFGNYSQGHITLARNVTRDILMLCAVELARV